MDSRDDVVVRQLTAADAEAFSALRRSLVADNPVPMGLTMEEELTRPMQGFRDQLSAPEPNAAFGAFIDGVLVGTTAVAWYSKFESSRHKAYLWGVFVSPQRRTRGIGRRLVQQALAHAASHGVVRVNLTVYLPNDAAVHLYKSLGFDCSGTEVEALRIGGVFYDGQFMSRALT